MRVDEWLRQAQTSLSDASIATARLDCLVLLEDELGKDRAWLLSHPEHNLQGSVLEMLNTKIIQRVQHTPLAYLRGHAEFYGRKFTVNEHTLVPRPETEAIIDLLLRTLLLQEDGPPADSAGGPSSCTVLDVGTGSGCIAITAALELRNVHVSACDIDPDCLEIAQQNATRLHANVTFFESNLLEGAEPCDIILANLPYVPDDYPINTAATHEPHLALFGGEDGLDLYRTMFEQIRTNDWRPKYILTESLPTQHEALAAIAIATGLHLQKTDDFIQLFGLVPLP